MEVFEFLMPIFTQYGYWAVFVMLLICGFGIPVPEDVTLVTGGVIAGLGHADVHTMFAVGMAGVLIGDGTMFILGRLFGPRIIRLPLFHRVLTPERFEKAQTAFHKYGKWVMFVARFLPGLRTPVFFSAGMSHRVTFLTWLLMDGFAALISVPVFVWLGHFLWLRFGSNFSNLSKAISRVFATVMLKTTSDTMIDETIAKVYAARMVTAKA
mgnify:CR=1 FL=1